MAILEFLRAGVPVVGGRNSGGVGYTMGHGAAGILVNTVGARDLANGMERLLRADAYSAASDEALRLATSEFSEQTVANQYLQLLEQQS